MSAGDFWWVPMVAWFVAGWAQGGHASHCTAEHPDLQLAAVLVALLSPFVIGALA
jgi:hypothetical protein